MCPNLRRRFAVSVLLLALVLPTVAHAAGEAVPPPVRPIPAQPPAKPGAPDGPAEGLAEIKLSREEAIAIARKTFPIPAEMLEPNISIYQSKTTAVWNLDFQTPSKKPDRMGISVQVDALTGDVRGYNRWLSGEQDLGPVAYTREEALTKANEWLNRLAPSFVSQVEFVDNPLSFSYYGGANANYAFNWRRLAEGHPVNGQGINLAISARTGELEQFSAQWQTEQVFTLPAAVLTADQAMAAYKRQVPMELQYMRFQKPGTEEGEWRLVYRPMTNWNPTLNQNGRLLGPDGAEIDLAPYLDRKRLPDSVTPYKAPEQPLSRAEALAVAQTVAGRSEEPTSSNYSEYGEETKTRAWSFSWSRNRELEPGEYNTEVRVDPELGLVVNMYNWTRHEPLKEGEEPAVSRAEAEAAATQFLLANRPDLAGKLQLTFEGDEISIKYRLAGIQPDSHRFSYQALRFGIPVAGQQVSVEVDARTGVIRSFWGQPFGTSKEPFPFTFFSAMAPEAAMDSFLKHSQLQAIWQVFYDRMAREMGKESDPMPTLVWTPAATLPVAAIDAISGVPLDYQGRDLVEAAKRPIDIAGHFAQREIELLWARGVFELTGGKFNPGESATAADVARWLILSRGLRPLPSYDFSRGLGGNAQFAAKVAAAPASAPFFGAALQSGIFLAEDFGPDSDPNAPVSREVFALWAVRAMGYGRIAAMQSAIEIPYADKASIGGRYTNAVAILHGLKIVRGDGVTFAPQRSVTRGEAAKVLFAITSEGRR